MGLRATASAMGLALVLLAGCGPVETAGRASTEASTPSIAANVAPTSPSPTAAPSAEPSMPPATDSAHGCPTDPAGAQAMMLALDHGLLVGGTRLDNDGTIVVEAIYGGAGGSDQIPAFASLDLGAAPIPAAAGGALTIREAATTLVALDAALYDRSGFTDRGEIRYVGRAARPLDTVVTAGAGRVSIPTEVGEYVLELRPSWNSPCFRGEGITWVVIAVR